MKRPAIFWACIATLILGLPQAACAQDDVRPEDVPSSLAAGRYAEAIDLSRRFLRSDPQDAAMRAILVESLAAIGHYDEALEEARGMPLARGRILVELGRATEAEAEFQQVIDRNLSGRLSAELALAEILFHRGEREEAMRRFDRFIDVYNNTPDLSAADLVAVGTAVRYLGIREPQLFQDAVKAYDEAIEADPQALEPRLLIGELFLEKYDSPTAHTSLQQVLVINPVHPRALLGMARAREFDGETAEAFELASKSLEINYQFVPAHVMLSRLKLDAENLSAAEEEVLKGLAVNPRSLEALSMLAGIRFLQGDERGFTVLRDSVLGLNPTYGQFYVTLADLAAQHRRYARAAEFGRLATEVDPESWSGYGALGLNELRLGRVEEAHVNLERSFSGDPYNAWIKNTLDLLDTYDDYELRTSPHFVFMLHQREADLLEPYMSELAEDVYAQLTTRYGFEPETPVRIEVYPRHADFSVRTVGLTGLGALGVAFGNVLALDSPAAREAGQLNWGSTLWHEFAHTIALGMSNNMVPRWFTEGLSVFEERAARPGWGSETTPSFMAAYGDGEIPPVSRLGEGFTRPPTPQHLGLAYHMASLVVEWIDETHGFPAIPQMLRAYGQGRSTAEVFRTVLSLEPQQVDEQFDRWLRARYPADRVTEYERRVSEAANLMRGGDFAQAEATLTPVLDLFEGGDPEALSMLARIQIERGDTAAAVATLAKVTTIDENAYSANITLAELATGIGDGATAAAALERVMYIYPYEIDLHRQLATLYGEQAQRAGAVRERRAIVALQPVDRAEALYQLALALRDAGDRAGARTQVIRALETAPAFERAQELLLELSGSPGGG